MPRVMSASKVRATNGRSRCPWVMSTADARPGGREGDRARVVGWADGAASVTLPDAWEDGAPLLVAGGLADGVVAEPRAAQTSIATSSGMVRAG